MSEAIKHNNVVIFDDQTVRPALDYLIGVLGNIDSVYLFSSDNEHFRGNCCPRILKPDHNRGNPSQDAYRKWPGYMESRPHRIRSIRP